MRLGKAVAGEGRHQFPHPFGDSFGNVAPLAGPGDEPFFDRLHLFTGVEMRHGPAQQIGVCQAQAGQFVGDAQHLLLIQDHAVGIG